MNITKAILWNVKTCNHTAGQQIFRKTPYLLEVNWRGS